VALHRMWAAAAVVVLVLLFGSYGFGMAAPPARPTISVRTYGAMGDGVTDDSAAFTQALAAIPAPGAMLLIPPGTYLLKPDEALAIPSNVLIQGSCEATTRLSVAAGTGAS
jgi:Pectate lyase superfamily protein